MTNNSDDICYYYGVLDSSDADEYEDPHKYARLEEEAISLLEKNGVRSKGTVIFFAVKDGKAISALVADIHKDHCIVSAATDPAHRRNGIATSLLNNLHSEIAYRVDCQSIHNYSVICEVVNKDIHDHLVRALVSKGYVPYPERGPYNYAFYISCQPELFDETEVEIGFAVNGTHLWYTNIVTIPDKVISSGEQAILRYVSDNSCGIPRGMDVAHIWIHNHMNAEIPEVVEIPRDYRVNVVCGKILVEVIAEADGVICYLRPSDDEVADLLIEEQNSDILAGTQLAYNDVPNKSDFSDITEE